MQRRLKIMKAKILVSGQDRTTGHKTIEPCLAAYLGHKNKVRGSNQKFSLRHVSMLKNKNKRWPQGL